MQANCQQIHKIYFDAGAAASLEEPMFVQETIQIVLEARKANASLIMFTFGSRGRRYESWCIAGWGNKSLYIYEDIEKEKVF